MRSREHAPSRTAANLAHSITRCSQLSRISSVCRAWRKPISVVSSGLPASSRSPSAAAATLGTRLGSGKRGVDASQPTRHHPDTPAARPQPPPGPGASSRTPPAPVSVTRRHPAGPGAGASSSRTVISSRARPIKLVTGAGRLVGGAWARGPRCPPISAGTAGVPVEAPLPARGRAWPAFQVPARGQARRSRRRLAIGRHARPRHAVRLSPTSPSTCEQRPHRRDLRRVAPSGVPPLRPDRPPIRQLREPPTNAHARAPAPRDAPQPIPRRRDSEQRPDVPGGGGAHRRQVSTCQCAAGSGIEISASTRRSRSGCKTSVVPRRSTGPGSSGAAPRAARMALNTTRRLAALTAGSSSGQSVSSTTSRANAWPGVARSQSSMVRARRRRKADSGTGRPSYDRSQPPSRRAMRIGRRSHPWPAGAISPSLSPDASGHAAAGHHAALRPASNNEAISAAVHGVTHVLRMCNAGVTAVLYTVKLREPH